jgi:type IV secretory pathway VirB2 component (pilin)
MNFRVFNQRFLEPGAMWLMIIGIIFLCQPWITVLHEWSVTIMLIGLVGFNVAAHVPPPETGEKTGATAGGHHG